MKVAEYRQQTTDTRQINKEQSAITVADEHTKSDRNAEDDKNSKEGNKEVEEEMETGPLGRVCRGTNCM